VPDDFDSANVNQHVMIIRMIEPEIRKFIHICMISPYIYDLIMSVQVGMSREGLSIAKLEKFILPIPPLAEQQRIVARVEELFAQTHRLAEELSHSRRELDRLNESALARLLASETQEEFNERWGFIAEHFDLLTSAPEHIAPLRQSILEMAVRGKLTRREAGDESAKELLKRLAKKPTFFTVQDDERPFDLPEGWAWIRFKDIGEIYGGKTPSMNNSEYWDGDIPWVSPKDMWEDVVTGSEKMITKKALDQMKLVPENSILIVVRSGILKRKLPVSINAVKITVNQDLKVIVPNMLGISRYLQLMLQGMQPLILKKLVKQGTTVQSVKWDEFVNSPFPLPPLAEQERIVKRVEQLLGWCDALEAQLKSAEEVRERLVESVLSMVKAGATN
jgi:type I restriction enzyme S subunit